MGSASGLDLAKRIGVPQSVFVWCSCGANTPYPSLCEGCFKQEKKIIEEYNKTVKRFPNCYMRPLAEWVDSLTYGAL